MQPIRRLGVRAAVAALVLVVGQTAVASAAPPPWRADDPAAGPSRFANELRGVAAIPGTSAFWAVGWHLRNGRHQALIERRRTAAGWTHFAAPVWSRGAELEAVVARSADDAWAVGERGRTTAPGTRPVALHWNGVAWASVPAANLGVSAKLAAVTVSGTGRIFAVGSYSSRASSGHSLVERFDGSAFIQVPIARTHGLAGIASGAGGSLWVGGNGHTAVLLHRPARSASWHLVSGMPLHLRTTITSVLVTGPGTTVWVFGEHYTSATTRVALVERYQAGAWTVVSGLAGGENVTSAARLGSRGFLAAGTTATGVFVWSDDGATLTAMTVPQPVANPANARILGIARTSSAIAELVGWRRLSGGMFPFAERNP
ncbi:MAG TPA: hypothetical protein VGL44_13475 [Gaiellales bacterium]